jgi:transcriptional regulator with XRE-family HTH domain
MKNNIFVLKLVINLADCPSKMDYKLMLEFLKKVREEKNISQKFIADKFEITQSQYAKIEVGGSQMSVTKFMLLCEILEVHPSDVFKIASGSDEKTFYEKNSEIFKKHKEVAEEIKEMVSIFTS